MKNLSKAKLLVWSILFCAPFAVLSQSSKASKLHLSQDVPTVFLLGEHNKFYEEMMSGQSTLLDVCDEDMNFAYDKLMGMMREMEAYAELVDFDLKGINAWMHFFWRPDGSIDHIGFHLKPNSKNVSTDLMKNFLEGFAKQYKLPLKHSKKFSHYSSFSFPLVKHNIDTEISRNTAKLNGDKGR